MSATKRHHELPGWRHEPDDNDIGAPGANFGPYERTLQTYYAHTHSNMVAAQDEAEAIKLTGEHPDNFRKIFKHVGAIKVNRDFRAGYWRPHTRKENPVAT